ncbi:hemolysin III family protein [Lagierella sp.]|uniref:PAQR family membrane homeostasis protein TrhA n=1 Tax=Lagierella sp. TaxID=2849657 RepID=UPI002619E0AC|nr:hemolysin III family protein [Lagierella sp.]
MVKTKEISQVKLEVLNSLTHGIGIILGVIFLLMLLLPSIRQGNVSKIVAFSIYGGCFILLFFSSTLYHSLSLTKAKSILRVLDHSSIYLFIAGSYMPIILLVLKGKFKIAALVIISALAISGVVYKILSYGKYDKYKRFSTLLYILMGWLALFLIRPIIKEVSIYFFLIILLGGIIYSGGTYFYKQNKRYSHVIWHLFVLAAAVTQFLAIYFFIL